MAKRFGGGNKKSTPKTEKTDSPKKESFLSKIRKKIVPTFGEQGAKARKEGKKVFRSTRDDKTKGKLEYATTDKKDVAKKIASNRAAEAKYRQEQNSQESLVQELKKKERNFISQIKNISFNF